MSAGKRISFIVISGSRYLRPPSGASVQAPVHNSERPKIERPPNLANGGISDRAKRGLRSQHVQPMSAWRKGWDSNPRGACTPGGFQDRCLKPLGHPSLLSNQLAFLFSCENSQIETQTNFGALTDSNTSPTSNRRLPGVPDAGGAAPATARRTSDRRRCPRWDWHQASPSSPRCRRGRTADRS